MFLNRTQAGFTLIEMLITVTIAGILLTLAIGGFTGLIGKSAQQSTYTEFSSVITYARSEALKQGKAVGLRADSGNNWNNGWKIWVDTDGGHDFDESAIRQASASSSKVTILSTENGNASNAFNTLYFYPSGRASFYDTNTVDPTATKGDFTICKDAECGTITVHASGLIDS